MFWRACSRLIWAARSAPAYACGRSILRSRSNTSPITSHAVRRIFFFSRLAMLHPINQPGTISLTYFARIGALRVDVRAVLRDVIARPAPYPGR